MYLIRRGKPGWQHIQVQAAGQADRLGSHGTLGRLPAQASRFIVLLLNAALASEGFFLGLAALRTAALRHPSRGPRTVVGATEPGGVGSGHLRVIWASGFHSLGLFHFLCDGLNLSICQKGPP